MFLTALSTYCSFTPSLTAAYHLCASVQTHQNQNANRVDGLLQGMLAAAKDFVMGAVRATPPLVAVPAAAVQSYQISPYRYTHCRVPAAACNVSNVRLRKATGF